VGGLAGRRRRLASYLVPAVVLAVAAAVIIAAQLLPGAPEPADDSQVRIEHFMAGLACVESGGRYEAVNPQSGAYGKYQIMPKNWPVWARRFLGDENARPTPENQEVVARARIERLYASRESWRLVAYWWLTGGSDPRESRWTAKALGYVDSVMRNARRAASPDHVHLVPERCFPSAGGLGAEGSRLP
jgi:hypothetical protein